MKTLYLSAFFIAVLSLVGCLSAVTEQTTPQAQVYQIKAAYATALDALIAYDSLPACEAAATPKGSLCSSATGTQKVRAAKDGAKTAIDAAESAVRSPSAGSDSKVTVYLTAAQASVQALVTLLAQIQEKK
jgi:hypothetical protein